MQPGRGYLYGSGFGYGPGPPYRSPVPPELQMAPQESEAVLMATGRLAAEYLTNRGDLPAKVLENRPPAHIPRSLVGVGGQTAFGSQYHETLAYRTFHFQGRPRSARAAAASAVSHAPTRSTPKGNNVHLRRSAGFRPPPVPSRPRPVPEAPTPRPVWTGFLPRRGTPAGHRHPSWTRMKISETMITSTVRRPEMRATLSRRRSRMFRPAASSRRTSSSSH